jgi:hypothetical protein
MDQGNGQNEVNFDLQFDAQSGGIDRLLAFLADMALATPKAI